LLSGNFDKQSKSCVLYSEKTFSWKTVQKVEESLFEIRVIKWLTWVDPHNNVEL
jgi:hypothetical protein